MTEEAAKYIAKAMVAAVCLGCSAWLAVAGVGGDFSMFVVGVAVLAFW